MAGLSGFSYYKEITISNGNVDGDLTNFPVFIPIVADADIGAKCRADGFDIQFANADNSESLTFERLPGFAVAGGAASGNFYVRVPIVDHDAATIIRCYYGKADATDVSSPENTFDTANGWGAVWHLEENGNPYYDATANDNDSTAGTYPDRATGKMSYGQDFELDSSEYISFPSTASLNLGTSDFTMSFWFKPETVVGAMITKQYSATPYYYLWCNAGGYVQARIHDGTNTVYQNCHPSITITAGEWYHLYVTVDRDSATGFTFVVNNIGNGNADPRAVLTLDNDNALVMGKTSYFFDGIIDEVRINKTYLGVAWGKFEYYNSHDGHAAGNELTWGAEQGLVAAYRQQVIMVM